MVITMFPEQANAVRNEFLGTLVVLVCPQQCQGI